MFHKANMQYYSNYILKWKKDCLHIELAQAESLVLSLWIPRTIQFKTDDK